MNGRVIQRTEFLVAQLLIEPTRLEAERIEPSRMTAAFNRTCFSLSHQLTSDTAAAEIVVDPKIFDDQPSAISLPRQAGYNRFCVAHENAERPPRCMAGPFSFVKVLQRLGKRLQRRRFGSASPMSSRPKTSSTASWYCCGTPG